MRSTRLRRSIAVLVAGLVAALLPLAGPAAPVHASPECLTEVPDILGVGCDDETPPSFESLSVSPVPNGLRFVRSNDVTFAFNAEHDDADTAPITYECRISNVSGEPGEWGTCTSPKSYSDLAEFTTTPYTFGVRAIDSVDFPLAATDGNPLTTDPDEDDFSVVTTTVKVDTVAPNTFITRTPVDDLRPDWPVTTTDSPVMTLNTNEGGKFKCTLNTKSYPCHEGNVVLRNLPGGNKVFTAQAVDYAGNVDPTRSVVRFYVPTNIKKAKNSSWKRVKAPGYFGNDYFTANEVGASLKIKGQRAVRELRLLAPSGRGYGKLEVRVGHGKWYTVNLHSSRSVRQKMYLVRDEYVQAQTGTLEIRVKSLPRGGSVSVDAYVARG